MEKSVSYTFARYEQKYFLTPAQQQDLTEILQKHCRPDEYGRYSISSLYYDTPDYRLVRASLQKPVYKEKLRLRSYGTPGERDPVFAELKKKYRGVVYKRRICLEACLAEPFLYDLMPDYPAGQIGREILRFQQVYRAEPKVFLAYQRTALAGIDDPELRITFDTDIRWRTRELDLGLGSGGAPLLPDDRVLMEIKFPAACPLWLSRALSALRIFPTSFSKYGSCYRDHILPTLSKEAAHHVLIHSFRPNDDVVVPDLHWCLADSGRGTGRR